MEDNCPKDCKYYATREKCREYSGMNVMNYCADYALKEKTKAERYEELAKKMLDYRMKEKARCKIRILEVEDELARLKMFYQHMEDAKELGALELEVVKKMLGDEPLVKKEKEK